MIASFDLIEDHRVELKAHCYRMLGSVFEAEDAVQEALVRAWRFSDRFEGRTTLRGWLYRIATNVCLTMLEGRKAKRLTPYLSVPPASDYPQGEPPEGTWLEPYPQAFLDAIPDSAPAPHARYEQKEATELAFVAAIAYLPPRQRAALILHDVLGWSAHETAKTLASSVASINSAVQRARETLRKKLPEGRDALSRQRTSAKRASLLERYVRAWDAQDLGGLVALLTDDATFSMPPRPEWYRGRDQILEFLHWAVRQTGFDRFHAVPTGANYQPAIVLFGKEPGDVEWRPHAVHVLTPSGERIAVIHNFMDPQLPTLFAEPAVLSSSAGA